MGKTLSTLREIADADEALNQAAQEYFDTHLRPRLEACRTLAEVRAIQVEVSIEIDAPDGRMRDLPAPISIGLLLYASKFIQGGDA